MKFIGMDNLIKSHNPKVKDKHLKVCPVKGCGVLYKGAGKTCKPHSYEIRQKHNNQYKKSAVSNPSQLK